MKTVRINLAVSMAVLLGAAALAMYTGPVGPLASANSATYSVVATAGFGFWEALGCVGCIAGFVVGAGTTVAGLAVFLAANPEIAILCVSTCAVAAT